MRLISTIVFVTVALVAAATSVRAHHAFASEFDARKPIKFTAAGTKMEWINPHSWMHGEVKKPDGTVEAWGRSESNPVGGWYGLRKGYRGRFGMYVPPLLEELGMAELTHDARNNRMRAV